MGLGYKGNTNHFHKVSENIASVAETYPVSEGYFGSPGDSGNSGIRHIGSPDPSATAKSFYDAIAHGGIEDSIIDRNGQEKGATTKMCDGTIITWREVSNSDGSPAVDINIRYSDDPGGLKSQRIHFVEEYT